MSAPGRPEREFAPERDGAEGRPRSIDWAGVAHETVRGRPRIACLVPSLTETLFALGAGDDVVARTGFCIHPRERVRSVPKVGGTKDPDLRKLAALAPTHLVVNVDENRREDVEAARAFVEHVIVTHPMAPEDNIRLVKLLGAIFGRDADAARLAASIEGAFRDLSVHASTLPRERVLYVIWRKPWMTVSRDTYISRTLALVGWDTLPADTHARYPELALDAAMLADAAHVLLSSEPYRFRERDIGVVQKLLPKKARCSVRLIDGEMTSWYGSRAIHGLRGLARLRASLA